MAVFQEIRLSWDGREFVIPAERVLGAIAEVEEVVTLPEILMMMGGKMTMAKLSRAYGALLRYAGASLSDDEVYGGLIKHGKTFEQMKTACVALCGLMIPPDKLTEAPASGNLSRAKAARSRLSKRSTKRRSVTAG